MYVFLQRRGKNDDFKKNFKFYYYAFCSSLRLIKYSSLYNFQSEIQCVMFFNSVKLAQKDKKIGREDSNSYSAIGINFDMHI
jgi:hypothetical protein